VNRRRTMENIVKIRWEQNLTIFVGNEGLKLAVNFEWN
jgi:hypothetical protein